MRTNFKTVILTIAAAVLSISSAYCKNGEPSKNNVMNLHSAYVDKIEEVKIKSDAIKDFGMESSVWKDQSSLLQAAIAKLSEQGGGVLYIPKGTYLFKGVRMMSNVHIVIEEGTILKPYWGSDDKVVMFSFNNDNSMSSEYIENCSIRAEKGMYIVNYSEVPKNQRAGIRFATFKMVKNFSVADADIRDNYTSYCAFSLSPADAPGSLSWSVDRPTNGEFIHCKISQANPGYGLIQMHGARNVYLEDMYANEGVTLRLETGANTPTIGVYDIFGRNIRNENGRSAIMMGPHVAQNGTVKVDGVWVKNTTFAVSAGGGPAGGKHGKNTVAGRFADDTKIINVHAIYGESASASTKQLAIYNEEQYDLIRYDDIIPYGKWIKAPSVAACTDHTGEYWDITYENVTTEGFPYEGREIIISDSKKDDNDPTSGNDKAMAIRGSIPQLKSWGGYTGDEFYTPKVPVADNEVKKAKHKN